MDKGPVILHQKLNIGISACCFGCPVRYNGKSLNYTQFLEREKSDFIWTAVCPETMAGLGIPRSPIHVIGKDGASVWQGEGIVVNQRKEDLTEAVMEGVNACVKTLELAKCDAYVYMDGSPICGVYRTTLKKQKRGNPPGVFGSVLMDKGYFLIPASDLQSPIKWWDWRRRLFAFTWIKSVDIPNKAKLYEVWYKVKFLCQEIDEPWARALGHNLAQLTDESFRNQMEDIRLDILNHLRQPSTTVKITNRLWKHYTYYRRKSGKNIVEINAPEFKRNVTTIAKEIMKMERAAISDGILFGNTPVMYQHSSENKRGH